MPELGGRSALNATLGATTQTDAEMARMLRYAARDIERALLVPGVGEVRRAQYVAALAAVRRTLDDLWQSGIGPAVAAGTARAADAAADVAVDTLVGYAAARGLDLPRDSFRTQARRGLETLRSRGVNDIPLSQSVYRGAVGSNSAIARVVESGLASGFSAREIARGARALIDPATPGGTSHAAMRLGRTEINNAFHTTSIALHAENPFVSEMAWHLSGSHPKADQCDTLANNSPYAPEKVPGKPHPQCFCFTAPIVPDDETFYRDFAAGKYDKYLDDATDNASFYSDTERERKAEIGQRRVVLPPGPQGGLRVKAIVDLSPAQRAPFLTAEERALLR